MLLTKLKNLIRSRKSTGSSDAIDHYIALSLAIYYSYNSYLRNFQRIEIDNFIQEAYGIHYEVDGPCSGAIYEMYIHLSRFHTQWNLLPTNKIKGGAFNYATLYRDRVGRLKVDYEVSLYE